MINLIKNDDNPTVHLSCTLYAIYYHMLFVLFLFILTALPFRVADFQITAGASRVLARSVRAADILNLAVNGFKGGINLHIMLSQIVGGLVSTHVTQGIRALLGLTQSSEGRHINARAWRTRKTRGSRVTRRTLKKDATKKKIIKYALFFSIKSRSTQSAL